MTNTSNFERDLIIGAKGEIIFYKYLKSLNKHTTIIDVSNDKHFQALDVDYILETQRGRYWIEVKYDSHTDGCKELNLEATHNICYETQSNGNVGCLARSHADLVYYITTKYIYWFDLKNIRQYIQLTQPIEIAMGDGARGYLLNVDKLLDAKVLHIAKGLKNGN